MKDRNDGDEEIRMRKQIKTLREENFALNERIKNLTKKIRDREDMQKSSVKGDIGWFFFIKCLKIFFLHKN